MDINTAKILNDLNRSFYLNQCDSFSQTRQSPWTGWENCIETFLKFQTSCNAEENVRVLDLACGNLRFEDFLAQNLPCTQLHVCAIDNCDPLAESGGFDLTASVDYHHSDIIGDLIAQKESGADAKAKAAEAEGAAIMGAGTKAKEVSAAAAAEAQATAQAETTTAGARENTALEQLSFPACDLSVSFGFMHHVPSQELREKVLALLVSHTQLGGIICVSFWQFMNNEKLADKARRNHMHALQDLHQLDANQLDAGDFILGWSETAQAYRYCHSFSETEIDKLLEAVSPQARCVERFAADGRDGRLNAYVVLQRIS